MAQQQLFVPLITSVLNNNTESTLNDESSFAQQPAEANVQREEKDPADVNVEHEEKVINQELVDIASDGLVCGLTFPTEDSAVQSILKWSEKQLCPIVLRLLPIVLRFSGCVLQI